MRLLYSGRQFVNKREGNLVLISDQTVVSIKRQRKAGCRLMKLSGKYLQNSGGFGCPGELPSF